MSKKLEEIQKQSEEALKNAEQIKDIIGKKEWFTIMELVSKSCNNHDITVSSLNFLRLYGLAICEDREDKLKYKIVSSATERDNIYRKAIEDLTNQKNALDYRIKKLEIYQNCNPWKDPKSSKEQTPRLKST